ncbi:Hypothetical Protein SLY_0661 [Strawberry lethal yellows phytoplasma (CPA) str. NZSb11]|uniref:Uncharacterized protein n=1 Tax=Strawberry lethal yellows phytoplasma (CPA) str. NZSb11 TaxID=980422 RepID=R4RQ09_PHYAS|nr:Hypothetical Protein SLY_0661 [Strawberry lethal yellows phytoplasma (CPA) str. NZSb11]
MLIFSKNVLKKRVVKMTSNDKVKNNNYINFF